MLLVMTHQIDLIREEDGSCFIRRQMREVGIAFANFQMTLRLSN